MGCDGTLSRIGVTIEEMQGVVGHAFPGGTFTIEPWENVLLCDVMGIAPLPDSIAHPAYLFHATLAGAGVRVADIFELCQAESDEAVRAGEYHWVMRRPLLVGATYRMSGGFTGVERKQGRRGGLMDVVKFQIEVHDEAGELVATTTSSWIFLRSS
jgi:hypothetical protein